jgi:hypothetical protein
MKTQVEVAEQWSDSMEIARNSEVVVLRIVIDLFHEPWQTKVSQKIHLVSGGARNFMEPGRDTTPY